MHLGCSNVVFQAYLTAIHGFCEKLKDKRPTKTSSTSSENLPPFHFHSIPPPRLDEPSPAFAMERVRHDTRSSRRRAPRQQQCMVQRPITVLGRSYSTWTVPFLRAFLRHYGRPQAHAISKTRLLQIMTTLAEEYNLDGSDYEKMYAAYWGRQEFPACKPSLAANSSPPIASPPATSRPRAPQRPQATLRPASLTGPTHHTQQKNSPEKDVNTRPTSSSLLKSGKTCIVCWDDLTPETTPPDPITSECTHGINVCRLCMSMSISSQLDSKMWDHITCPSCEAKMNYASVEKFASTTTLARYDQLALQAVVAASGGHLQQCRHPGCTSIQECFPDTDSYMICQQCSGRTCIKCDVMFHAGISCTDRNSRLEAGLSTDPCDLATEQLLSGKAKNCPKCGVRGMKIEGCDHMTCPRCRYQYCWICFADYLEISKSGNDAHEETCRYHSTNLSPEHDYEVDDEEEYDSYECDDEDDEDAEDDETDLPSLSIVGRTTELTGNYTSLTPSRHLTHQAHDLDDRAAASGNGFPYLPPPRDFDAPHSRDQIAMNDPVREESDEAVVGMASAIRDLRRRARARMPLR